MRVAFCITCKGRSEHIKQTLPINLTDNPDALFILLNYNSGDDLFSYITKHHKSDLASGRLVLFSTSEPDRFKMAHAKNMAHRLGIAEGADILVNLDADNFAGPGFASYLKREFKKAVPLGREYFMWSRMIKGQTDRGISGRIAVTKNAFLLVGGYDEKYDTWGPDDEDFKARLRMLGCESGEIAKDYLRAIRHSDKSRFREYPKVLGSAYGDRANCNPVRVLVNSGRVGLGVVCRNTSNKRRSINPIPTRIFGIGMHKTGTTSLCAAFTILGFKSAHWNTALWARDVYHQVMIDGISQEVDRHYAFSDLPFPLLYKRLDEAYPGSKFILTIRPEHKWLNSIEKHWDVNVNPNRKYWEIAPFTHKLHQILYGQKSFDRKVFAERYHRHNKEVWEYFKHRPEDLLTMNIDDGWEKLCKFLDRPVPLVPFPHELATASYHVPDFCI